MHSEARVRGECGCVGLCLGAVQPRGMGKEVGVLSAIREVRRNAEHHGGVALTFANSQKNSYRTTRGRWTVVPHLTKWRTIYPVLLWECAWCTGVNDACVNRQLLWVFT